MTTRTITITGTIARQDAVVAQVKRILERVVQLKDPRLSQYLVAVRKEYISKFTFYGLPPGTQSNAKEYFIVEIDWKEHNRLVASNPMIGKNDDWDGDINPDIIYESQEFMERCTLSGLEITWDFSRVRTEEADMWFHDQGIVDRNRKGNEYVPPKLPDGNTLAYSPYKMKEIKMKKNI